MGNVRASVLLVLASARSLVFALIMHRAAGTSRQPGQTLAVWG